jgi:hypothetical protein
VTGVTLSVTGSAAADGTNLTVTSTNYGGTAPPSVTGVLQINGAAYCDVHINSTSALGSDATATVAVTNVDFNANSVMSYWNGTDWNNVPTQFIAPDTLVGTFPVSALTGTPIIVQPSVHDVMATGIAADKTVIGKSFLGNVTVTVANSGAYAETFNLTAYANTTTIASENVTLTPSKIAIITLAWNTTDVAYGNYTISAYAQPVPGETNTADNNCTGGWIIVSIPCDITGPTGWPDGKVTMRDIAIVARAFGSKPGASNWNPNADINNDGKIDMKDVALAARNFGQHYP